MRISGDHVNVRSLRSWFLESPGLGPQKQDVSWYELGSKLLDRGENGDYKESLLKAYQELCCSNHGS